MKEEIFKIRYTPYLENKKTKDHKWTRKVFNNKIILTVILLIISCIITNCVFIYKFVTILESNRFF